MDDLYECRCCYSRYSINKFIYANTCEFAWLICINCAIKECNRYNQSSRLRNILDGCSQCGVICKGMLVPPCPQSNPERHQPGDIRRKIDVPDRNIRVRTQKCVTCYEKIS